MKNNKLCILAAVSIDGWIGIDNNIPWNIPEDLQHFKKLTTGNHLIIGSTTYKNLPDVAKQGRVYHTLTHDINNLELANPINNISELLEMLDNNLSNQTIYVVGGSEIYNQLIGVCDDAIITWVNAMFRNANKSFPIEELFSDFTIIGDHNWEKSASGVNYKITHYKRDF